MTERQEGWLWIGVRATLVFIFALAIMAAISLQARGSEADPPTAHLSSRGTTGEPPVAWSKEPPSAWSGTDGSGTASTLPQREVRDYQAPAPPGQKWVRYPGQDWKLERDTTPGVVVQQPFRPAVPARNTNTGFAPDHQCDRCGRFQYVISGYNPDGTHNHRCSSCGNTWRH